jgi:hypothetical protein
MGDIVVFKAVKGKKGTEKLKGGFYFASNEEKKKDRVFVFYFLTEKEEFTAYISPSLVLSEIAKTLGVKLEEKWKGDKDRDAKNNH